MSLMSRIGRRLVASAPKAVPAPKFVASPVHPGKAQLDDPRPSPLPPKPRPMPMAERRALIAEGHARRNAPPVPTSAPPFRFPSATPPGERARVEARALAPVQEKVEPAGIEAFGEPLPAPPPTPAPPSAAIVAAASVAGEKALAAAKVDEMKKAIDAGARWVSQCKAVDAATGFRCGLLSGHTVEHKHARGTFRTIAQGRLQARAVDGVAWNTNN